MLKRLLLLPNAHLSSAIPMALALGLVTGLLLQVPQVPGLLMPAIVLMVYPVMVGVPWREVMKLQPARLMWIATTLNFVLIPATAWLFAEWFLDAYPVMKVGLILTSLLPTSGMTISWTHLSRGNVPAAVRLTVLSLLGGSLLMPFYLLVMLGADVPMDIWLTLARIGMTVVLPALLGVLTTRLLARRFSHDQMRTEVKPYLTGVSTWALLYVVFMAMATRAPHLLANPAEIAAGAAVVAAFYAVNFTMGVAAGRWLLGRADAYTLVYSTVLRNLSIALAMAVSLFGAQAALLVTLAFIFQVQAAAWFARLSDRHSLFREEAVQA